MDMEFRQDRVQQRCAPVRRRSLAAGVVTAAVLGVIAAPVAAYAAPSSPSTPDGSVSAPAAPQSSRGFKVTNLTGHPLKIRFISGAKFEGRPSEGDVLQPGQTHDFEVTYLYGKLNEAAVQYVDATSSDPFPQGFGLTLSVDSTNPLAPPKTRSNCVRNSTSNGNDGQCETSGQDIKFKDSPGTHYDVPSSDPQIQYQTVKKLCAAGMGKCDFTNVKESKFYSEKHQVGGAIINNTDRDQEFTIGVEDTVGSSTSWGAGAELGGGIDGIVNAKISTEYREEWNKAHTFKQDVKVTVQPHYKSWVSATDPMVRETGDFTINFGNTSWTIRDVSFEFADPKQQADFVIDEAPLTAQEQATAPNTFNPPRQIRGDYHPTVAAGRTA
ncbi:hypothetical protein K4749_39645 [Streptomyces sp. TRM72054]|uniref:hypothetical protein n=1 Tax=Streptomyces sp. TRM72054 TaxID=2870562 RepID=UPI001C8B4AB5|nr:hypothetical protein [Streptomyces sp. TRM72054]MBX9399488.1 hypothetical protein [Streptomyces sp. TRM72054]